MHVSSPLRFDALCASSRLDSITYPIFDCTVQCSFQVLEKYRNRRSRFPRTRAGWREKRGSGLGWIYRLALCCLSPGRRRLPRLPPAGPAPARTNKPVERSTRERGRDDYSYSPTTHVISPRGDGCPVGGPASSPFWG